MSDFRLSPNQHQAHQINWLPWGEAAFAKAQSENKPVLLSISAVWCYWCHVMDETSYSDEGVREFINQNFVPVRVDNDHRPDINGRYNVGGWPTTAYLTGHGGLIGGATYLPPDQMMAMLSELEDAYRQDRTRLYDQSRQLLTRRKEQANRVASGPEVEAGLVDRVSRIVVGAYDAAHGGFGSEPKFLNPTILSFLVHLFRTTGEDFYRAMLRKSLDCMIEGAGHDREEGGFFRHCGQADWSEPQREKMLDDNLSVAQVFVDAGLLLEDDLYLKVGSQVIDYTLRHLFDDNIPAFHGSQGAHSDYFSLSLEDRGTHSPPLVDPSCYCDTNARAIVTLLDVAWKLGRPELIEIGLEILEVLDMYAKGGKLSHVYGQDGASDGPAFLSDWADLLQALMRAHQFTAKEEYLERAKSVAANLMDRFFDQSSGGFFDIEEDKEAVGHLQVREKSLPENAAAALGLIRLYHATRNDDYRQLAEATLSAFVETYREYGEYSAPYGLAVHLLLNSPVEITVEGSPGEPTTQDMMRAASRITSPNLAVVPMRSQDAKSPARAHVCLNTVCLAPLEDPAQLASAVSGMLESQSDPFVKVFDLLPGS